MCVCIYRYINYKQAHLYTCTKNKYETCVRVRLTYVCVFLCVGRELDVYICTQAHKQEDIQDGLLYACECVCVYVCMYVCLCVCIYIYIYIAYHSCYKDIRTRMHAPLCR